MEKQLHLNQIYLNLKSSIVLLLGIFIANSVFGHTGSVKGTITEAVTFSKLSKASISIESEGLITSSNENGQFQFTGLPVGNYTISIFHVGFTIQELSIQIKEGVTSELNVILEHSSVTLPDLIVTAKSTENASLIFNQLDFITRPVNNGQDLLRLAPGLLIAQHAGGGKAEQIFFRGFDIDHGTDIAITLDGIPVNMVSHAHGQGYADCHFIIPETIGGIELQKGPYAPEAGNLATSGIVEMNTLNSLENSFIRLEGGNFNTYHFTSGINIIKSADQTAYIAGDILFSDGYFESPQNFKRYNFYGKYTKNISNNQSIRFSLSRFSSSWNASGQIPDRAVKSGLIGRFGSIDNTEGGFTSRNDYSFAYLLQLDKVFWKNQLSLTQYDFELYSNFTFFSRDSINGDQIRQKESRTILNYLSTIEFENYVFDSKINTSIGLNLRNDIIDNSELSYTLNRSQTLETVSLGNIDETNLGVFVNNQLQLNKKLHFSLILRYDVFRFIYEDHIEEIYRPVSKTASVFSPRIGFDYNVNNRLGLFIKTGYGFHSNDIRSVFLANANEILPEVLGLDLGFTYKPLNNILLQLTAWQLRSANELVYVGDEGIVEQAGRSVRKGIELLLRYQFVKNIIADFELNYTHGRLQDTPENENRIPLAPSLTSSGGINYVNESGINVSLRYRYVSDRPANETNTITASGYFLVDLVSGYKYKNIEFNISIQNLLNSKWREAQFETTSRLKHEPADITEIHYTPGTPFNIKAGITVRF